MNLGCYDELGRSSELLLRGRPSVEGIICEKSKGKLYKASLMNIKIKPPKSTHFSGMHFLLSYKASIL